MGDIFSFPWERATRRGCRLPHEANAHSKIKKLCMYSGAFEYLTIKPTQWEYPAQEVLIVSSRYHRKTGSQASPLSGGLFGVDFIAYLLKPRRGGRGLILLI